MFWLLSSSIEDDLEEQVNARYGPQWRDDIREAVRVGYEEANAWLDQMPKTAVMDQGGRRLEEHSYTDTTNALSVVRLLQ